MMKILLLVLVCFSDIFILSSCLLIRQYHYIDNYLTWTEAQTYCRQNYIDLAIIESPEEQEKFLKSTTSSSYKAFWIGLHNEINWKWSDGFIGGITTDNYWTSQDQYHSRTDQICLTTSRTNRLSDFDCGLLLTFICYKVKKYSVKLRLKTNGPVNLNDPAVKAELLKKFQKDLTDKGVSGVELKWTEQRDGNVFKKENEKNSEL
ncbi:CD209 antigen-like protein D [Oryzias melastigma]|uniref:CD209 antigen-like protein D n=1 Tax=Oryzias melastigma TaxID=30732 RepID=A0A834L2N7_ORYME|nr:CD209 antigen-like protein D [Oryzias melastigma]